MQLRDFAESILCADTLEAKLAAPTGAVVDDAPGKAIALPDAPGRPEALRFAKRPNAQHALPKTPELESEAQRGALLHFFANHELLATELMALVLLRFPDAPAEFRRGVYETLREEQKHTLWYVRRMQECGIQFGDYPLSGFFWKCVAPMETPLDYVSRLSLTFEQANLDYSRYFAQIFRDSGDIKSARILQHIYRDEIGHVNYGLEWFRKWKDESQTDWEAFSEQLDYPLSPSRAKANGGAEFNAKGRIAAGLDENFVRELQSFERSKGRTPRVFWFCPDAENQMAANLDGSGYHRKADVRALQQDLDILPAFLSSREDIVLVKRMPSLEHREQLREWGFLLPEFEVCDGESLPEESLVRARKLAELCPWAWCPASARLLQPLEQNLPEGATDVGERWNVEARHLFSKVTDVEWSNALLHKHERPFLDPAMGGRVATTEACLEEAVRSLQEKGVEELVLKSPFGASAQKNQRWKGEVTMKWAGSVLRQQGAVIVEPWLERVLDFSMHYQMEPDGLRKLGFVRLFNDIKGQFQAVQCGPKTCEGMPEELARFLHQGALAFYDEILQEALETHLRAYGYIGPVGVDALVYRDAQTGNLRLRPVVEINPRYTMGRLAWELRRRVASGCAVRLELRRSGDVQPEQVEYRGEPRRLSGGTVVLNEPVSAAGVQVVLRVAKRQPDLMSP